jgi:hypothetical protein
VPLLVERTRADQPPATRAAAALALGLVAGGGATDFDPRAPPGALPVAGVAPEALATVTPGVVKALAGVLSAGDARLRDTACWALMRWRHPEAAPALRALAASDRDVFGRAALALSVQGAGDSGVAAELARTLESLSGRTDPAGLQRRALVVLALARLRHAPVRPAAAALAQLGGTEHAFPRFAAREALRELDPPAAGGGRDVRTLWVDPITPIERTGLRLRPGQSLDIRVSGYWGWGEPPSASHLPSIPSRPHGKAPVQRLVARVAGRSFTLAVKLDWTRIVAEEAGELVLLTLDEPLRRPPGSDPALLPAAAAGGVRVEIRP